MGVDEGDERGFPMSSKTASVSIESLRLDFYDSIEADGLTPFPPPKKKCCKDGMGEKKGFSF